MHAIQSTTAPRRPDHLGTVWVFVTANGTLGLRAGDFFSALFAGDDPGGRIMICLGHIAIEDNLKAHHEVQYVRIPGKFLSGKYPVMGKWGNIL